ncbi:hypothetical protein OHB13_18655 [Streptomyces sp. NBC_00440]|uniref:hypothetical protein n=1 Tax=unclassified Streptomyces TaxID=2593676 RepID=UPI002E2130C2|nr:hypothetical protein OG221_18960 [Streptomyces sp. NBC_00932]
MKRQRSLGRVALAAVAAVCSVGAFPGQAAAVGEPGPYAFDHHATTVAGAVASTDAKQLKAGSTYRSSIEPGGQLYYQVELDAASDAYVSAVAVPRLGPQEKVDYADGIKVSLQDLKGNSCGNDNDAVFGSAGYPRPIAAHATRTVKKDGIFCQSAGPYYVLIERTTKATSAQDEWGLEIRVDSEPGLKSGSAGPTEAPSSWPSASPVPPAGTAQRAEGGTGFNDAAALKPGVWDDRIKPGQTRFYRVPVGWGQQLFASTDLGSSTGSGFVASALSVQLYNPVRSAVSTGYTLYDGKPKSAAPDPLPPVAYRNRYSVRDEVSGARMAGDYYLAVTLSPDVAKSFGEKGYGLTLRMSVKGTEGPPPAYAGAVPHYGTSAGESAGHGAMRLVGIAGISAGTVLVLGLGVWTLLARRRAGTVPVQQQGRQSPPQYGPPSAW